MTWWKNWQVFPGTNSKLKFILDDTQGLLADMTDGWENSQLGGIYIGTCAFLILLFIVILLSLDLRGPFEIGLMVIVCGGGSCGAFLYGTRGLDLYDLIFDLIPDTILRLALFPLSVLVILSSQTVGEVLINLVAMQIFAQLDDILVKMIVRPDLSNGQVLLSYVKAPKLEKEEKN